MGFSDEKFVALFQVSEMLAGRHSRNLILGKDCCRIASLTAYLLPNG